VFFYPTDSADLGLIDPIPEYIPHGECENNNKWHAAQIGERMYRIDMESIDQYKRVLSHGGKIRCCLMINQLLQFLILGFMMLYKCAFKSVAYLLNKTKQLQ